MEDGLLSFKLTFVVMLIVLVAYGAFSQVQIGRLEATNIMLREELEAQTLAPAVVAEDQFYRGVYAACYVISKSQGAPQQVAIPGCLKFTVRGKEAGAYDKEYPGLDNSTPAPQSTPKILQGDKNA